MNLAWHVARKDLRRFALPVAFWIAFLVGPLVAFRFFSPELDGHMASSLDASLRILSIWLGILAAAQGMIIYALTGALVLEDPWRSTTAFWRTRPIARPRLLAAKAIGAGVAFLVAPVVVLAVAWFGLGFGVPEIAAAAWAFAKVYGGIATVAFALAVASRHLAQLFFHTIVLGGVVAVVGFFAGPAIARALRPDVRTSGMVMRSAERPEDRAAEIVPEATMTKFSGKSVPTLFVAAPWAGDRGYVPAFARLSDGSIAWGPAGPGTVQAGLRALGFDRETGPLRWQIQALERGRMPGDDVSLEGTLEVWAGRMRVVGEMPVRVGGAIANGAAGTRIVGVNRLEGKLDAIFVEERDTAIMAAGRWDGGWSPHEFQCIDFYYLVNRAVGRAHGLWASTVGAVEIASLSARYRRLSAPGADTGEDCVLIKLRFEIERRFERPLDVRGVTTPERKAKR